MNSRHRARRGTYPLAFMAMVIVFVGGWALLAGTTDPQAVLNCAQCGLPKPNGSPQLISYEKLPPDTEEDGAMCEYPPSEARNVSFDEVLQEQEQEARESRANSDAKVGADPADVSPTKDFSQLKPVRMIRDPYSSYSSVAVDPERNEVVVTDENLFKILVYNRLDNTPPTQITQPIRYVGGLNTDIEFQCGVYVDPKTGDIYAVNNDTVDRLVIFSPEARGDVDPDRMIHTPHGTFGIAVDEQHNEVMLSVQHDSAVVTYHKNASGNEPPIRLLQGSHTLLADPHGIAIDTKDDLLFVANHGSVHEVHPPEPGQHAARTDARFLSNEPNWPLGREDAVWGSGKNVGPSITVYDRAAVGDTPPIRVIKGPKTQMDWPTGLAYDAKRNLIFVANDMGSDILVFSPTADGDVSPLRILKGPKTLIKNPTGLFVDEKNDELWVASFGDHTVTAFSPDASGDVPPKRVIRSAPQGDPALGIGNPHPIAYDSKREEILVPN